MKGKDDRALRDLLRKLLAWEDAHLGFEAAVEGVPPKLRGVAPKGLPYSLWQLLEHMRRCQLDILEFCRNPAYREPPHEEYWPPSATPPSEKAWKESIESFRRDLTALQRLAADRKLDLFAEIPHGTGQTYARELVVVADHNAYHLGQFVAVRRLLGIWK
jgi:uncharacterized damage-inducible protein DinB